MADVVIQEQYKKLMPQIRASAESAVNEWCRSKDSTYFNGDFTPKEIFEELGWTKKIRAMVFRAIHQVTPAHNIPIHVVNDVCDLPEFQRLVDLTQRILALEGHDHNRTNLQANWAKEIREIAQNAEPVDISVWDLDTGDVYITDVGLEARLWTPGLIHHALRESRRPDVFVGDADVYVTEAYPICVVQAAEARDDVARLLKLQRALYIINLPRTGLASQIPQEEWAKLKLQVITDSLNHGWPLRPPNDDEIDRIAAAYERRVTSYQDAVERKNAASASVPNSGPDLTTGEELDPRYEGLENIMRHRPERGTRI